MLSRSSLLLSGECHMVLRRTSATTLINNINATPPLLSPRRRRSQHITGIIAYAYVVCLSDAVIYAVVNSNGRRHATGAKTATCHHAPLYRRHYDAE